MQPGLKTSLLYIQLSAQAKHVRRGEMPPGRNALRSTGKLEQIMRHAPVQFRGEDNSYTRWPATGGGSRKTALKVRMTVSNSTEVTAMGRAETVPVPLCKGLP